MLEPMESVALPSKLPSAESLSSKTSLTSRFGQLPSPNNNMESSITSASIAGAASSGITGSEATGFSTARAGAAVSDGALIFCE